MTDNEIQRWEANQRFLYIQGKLPSWKTEQLKKEGLDFEPQREGFLPFEEAREIVRTVGLYNNREWKIWSKTKRPYNIPSNPAKFYKSNWISITDWITPLNQRD
jgi:hypothetical protein